jgi:hypothetical protein
MKRLIKVLFLAAAITFIAPPIAAMVGSPFSFLQAKAEPSLKIPKFIFGRLKCAANVNAFLRINKRRVTNSLASASFLRFTRVSKPRKGDIRYNKRPGSKGGGHVLVYWGGGQCLNPRQNKGWKVVPCSSVWGKQRATWVRP